MLTKAEFYEWIAGGVRILDGATGSNLRASGMPRGCSTELWVLEHPGILQDLQRQYARAGSRILFAPTFQCQPIALEAVGRAQETEKLNARLVALTKEAAPGCLVAGDITTLAAYCDSWNTENMDLLIANYRRQIRTRVFAKFASEAKKHFPNERWLFVSSLNKRGIQELRDIIEQAVL